MSDLGVRLGLYIINDAGDVEPCSDTLEWGAWLERLGGGPASVARTMLPNGVKVSTIFLAIDHGFGSVPLLFETMIFFGHQSLGQFRYPDWAVAAAHHLELVAHWSGRAPNE